MFLKIITALKIASFILVLGSATMMAEKAVIKEVRQVLVGG